jgi:hypothetical protein
MEMAMPLDRVTSEPVEGPSGVRFAMRHGSGLIPCRVTAEALWHLTGGRYRLPLEAFAALRPEIEFLASEKYDVGLLDADGGVTINFADVAGRAPKSDR